MGSDKYNFNSLATQAKKDLAETLQDFKMGDLDLKNLKNSDLINLQRLLTPKMSKYIPHTPTPKQTAFLLLNCKEAFYGGAAGGGKALALDTPILTKLGWKTIGTLTLQDYILAQDGTWTTIEYITNIQLDHDCFEVTFNSGETIVADAEHLWSITEYKYRKAWYDKVLTTAELTPDTKLISTLPVVGEVMNLPVAPYVFGFWLGDGNARTGSVTIGNEDYLEMCQYLPPLHRYESMELQYTVENLTTQLQQLNILRPKNENRQTCPETKHIPVCYLLSSYEQRLELLRGIMDSDGHCQERGRCEISLKERRLFEDLCTLLSTLGIVYCVNTTKVAYKATFSTTLDIFKLTRKRARLPKKILHNKNTIVAIKPVARHDVKCIRIKHPSHVFLVGKTLLPTHNSDALLMGGLQYVDVQGYSGIIFRKTYADLTKPGALIDRAKSWLLIQDGTRWNDKDKRFEFYEIYGPHKNTVSNLQFGYLENSNDKFNYQGGEYQYIGFDELTHIDEASYKYMFSRLRRLKNVKIPLRVRGASNPPEDDGGIWVKKRFIDEGPAKGRVFIPAGMNDNPYLDTEEYEEALQELDPISRARLKDGNWEIVRKGNMFKRSWIEIVDSAPIYGKDVRWWDMAASDEEKAAKRNKSNEPDYTASVKCREFNGVYYVTDIIRERLTPVYTEKLQQSTAKQDGHMVSTFEEQEPGSSGIAVISNKSRTIFKGYAYKGMNSTGSKVQRAQIASAACENHNIKIVKNCRNIDVFLDELESFPGGIHDDMVDCLSGCITQLSTTKGSNMPIIVESVTNSDARWADEIDLLPGYYEGVDSRW